jgi:hypothetical protein
MDLVHKIGMKLSENKPFKDIAESLYRKGIASYRFDKRNKSGKL